MIGVTRDAPVSLETLVHAEGYRVAGAGNAVDDTRDVPAEDRPDLVITHD